MTTNRAVLLGSLLGAIVCVRPMAGAELPRIEDYPASEKFVGKPAAPALSSAEARRFRTIIRRDVAAGPNFAGKYTIASWGCGSTCVAFAVVDAQTGAVYFHPEVRSAMQAPYQTESVLQFRLDSRLLIIAGETEGPQGQRSGGRFYYEWKDNRFSLVGKADIQLEPGAPPLPPGMKLDDLCSGIDNSLECAQEIESYQLQKPDNTRRVQRSGAQLRLRLDGGRWLAVNDQPERDEASAVKHNFREYLPQIGCFLIHRQHYEGVGYLLIHARTGHKHELHAPPVISPDKRRLVTASDGVSGGYSPNAIQIWKLTGDGIELEQTIEPKEWGPADARWIDDRTIHITKQYPAGAQGQPSTSLVILKRNGRWQVQQPRQ